MAPGPATRGMFGLRRARAALVVGVIVAVVLLVVVGVLALRRDRTPSSARPAATASPSASKAPTVADMYRRVGPSVVVVRTARGALGSGVVAADNGTVLTAEHVIADGSPLTLVFSDGTTSAAKVASANAASDVATLAPVTLPQTLVPATLGGAVQVGGQVVAIGNPLGLTYSVSSGVISGLNRTASTANGKFSGLIQFDASVNPGSSGGPLLDANGLVIGIVVSIANPARADAFAGIGFAVPIGTALGGSGPGAGRGPQL